MSGRTPPPLNSRIFFLKDNSKDENPMTERTTHLDISHLSNIQQALVSQMTHQFKLANTSNILVSNDDYGHNNHSENCLLHPKKSAR